MPQMMVVKPPASIMKTRTQQRMRVASEALVELFLLFFMGISFLAWGILLLRSMAKLYFFGILGVDRNARRGDFDLANAFDLLNGGVFCREGLENPLALLQREQRNAACRSRCGNGDQRRGEGNGLSCVGNEGQIEGLLLVQDGSGDRHRKLRACIEFFIHQVPNPGWCDHHLRIR